MFQSLTGTYVSNVHKDGSFGLRLESLKTPRVDHTVSFSKLRQIRPSHIVLEIPGVNECAIIIPTTTGLEAKNTPLSLQEEAHDFQVICSKGSFNISLR